MLPTVSQPLAATSAGAARLAAPDAAAASVPAPLAGAVGAATRAARAEDGFVAAAKKARVRPGSTASAARPRSTGAGYATAKKAAAPEKAATSTASSAAAARDPLAFLDDRNLSVEEKLMRLLAHLSAKWDKDIEEKLKELRKGQQKSSSSAAAAIPKKSGLLGSIGGLVKEATRFFPAVGIAMEALRNPTVRAALSKVSGPVLAAAATALGYPSLSPLLLKYGSTAIELAAGVATSLDSGSSPGAAGTSSGSSASASSPSETGMNDSELRVKLMEIERIQNLQKEMFSLVSNILRAGHETRMNVIQNVR